MAKSLKIKGAEISSEAFSAKHRNDAFRAFHGQLVNFGSVANANHDTVHFDKSTWRLGPAVMLHCRQSASFQAIDANNFSRALPIMLSLRFYLKGEDLGQVQDTPVRLGNDSLHLFPIDYTLHTKGQSEFIACAFGYEAVGYQPSHHAQHLAVGLKSFYGQVLQSLLLTARRTLPDQSGATGKATGNAIIALVRGLLQESKPCEETRQALVTQRAMAMQRYVRKHLHDPEQLELGHIGDTFGASRSVVYRAFNECGGLNNFVRRERLLRAYAELYNADPSWGMVSRVAQKWGFANSGYFSRAFKEELGMTPMEVSEQGQFQRAQDSLSQADSGAKKKANTPFLSILGMRLVTVYNFGRLLPLHTSLVCPLLISAILWSPSLCCPRLGGHLGGVEGPAEALLERPS